MAGETAWREIHSRLKGRPLRWVVTGGAGFIGSHLLETLLHLGQKVTTLDNFVTGSRDNLDDVRRTVGEAKWRRHELIEGDVRDLTTCRAACRDADIVLHQAALGSVPRSLGDPLGSNDANVNGFLTLLIAARDQGVQRFVYASSSAVYGDEPRLPKTEERIGRPLSPYAVTKRVNELYADTFARCYGMQVVGLRYFNVFGPRQDPDGPYAAVIPRWVRAMLDGEEVVVNGDGSTSRDFCFVANAVQANLLAAMTQSRDAVNQVYNVATGTRTTLKELFLILQAALAAYDVRARAIVPRYAPFRDGDVRHSEADLEKAERLLGYASSHSLRQGLEEALPWYVRRFSRAPRDYTALVPQGAVAV